VSIIVANYPAAVAITGDRAANLDMCLALTLLAVRILLRANTCLEKGPLFLSSYTIDPRFSLLIPTSDKGAITTYFGV
jgi:hypothetical protein